MRLRAATISYDLALVEISQKDSGVFHLAKGQGACRTICEPNSQDKLQIHNSKR